MAKDIFDLFKENEHKLEQTPPSNAWSRIERRIQPKAQIASTRRIRPSSRPLSIAAALALVIGLSVVMVWIVGKDQQRSAIAMAQGPLEMEELVITTQDVAKEIIDKTVQAQYSKPLKPINEGRPEQKLIATSSKVNSKPSSSNSPIDSTDNQERMGK